MSTNPLLRLRSSARACGTTTSSAGCSHSGALQRLIDDDGVVGVTSNPTIFQKAVEGSAAYDHVIGDLAGMGLSTDRDRRDR